MVGRKEELMVAVKAAMLDELKVVMLVELVPMLVDSKVYSKVALSA